MILLLLDSVIGSEIPGAFTELRIMRRAAELAEGTAGPRGAATSELQHQVGGISAHAAR